MWWSKLLANRGFSAFAGMVGKAGRGIARYGGRGAELFGTRQLGHSLSMMSEAGRMFGPSWNMMHTFGTQQLGAKFMGSTGGLAREGFRQFGQWGWRGATGIQRAARIGGMAGIGLGAYAAGDFLNPWGFGWGD